MDPHLRSGTEKQHSATLGDSHAQSGDVVHCIPCPMEQMVRRRRTLFPTETGALQEQVLKEEQLRYARHLLQRRDSPHVSNLYLN